ncbi:hypothetical protein [Dyadobacter sp. CY347]|uniref:hypothetical protein n=1 Tax=Dyadobacter sp. CY347 TaxID=2909336 RepID=UPI001F4000C8|nr:hypothetical protein [Dyadobacter sp. CY347]MCF2488591.1 hypothetical protein [Dyadobacter sp. CY347]
MKKPIISFLAAMLFATTISYSQNATVSGGQSTHKSKQGQSATQKSAASSKNQSQSSKPAATPSNPKPEGKSSANNADVKSSARPGGAANDNANDVGKYSKSEDSKSLLNSEEAVAKRKKNLTESDTTMKKGSGSAPKNVKNHTGKTNNYKNEATKHNSKP